MTKCESIRKNEQVILERTKRFLHENGRSSFPIKKLNEVEMTAQESEYVITDLINAIANKEPIPSKYEKRGFESLYALLKPTVNNTAEVYGKKKLATSKLWRDITGKSTDTSKTDIKSDKNYSVKYGPAQLMSGVAAEAHATFIVAAEKSGLSSDVEKQALELLDGLVSYSGRTIGPKMTTKAIRKLDASKIQDDVNKKARALIDAGTKSQQAFKEYMIDLFSNNQEFKRQFIYEAMTGNSKFSDATAIADTMLCINKNATKLSIKAVTSASDSYVQKVVGATSIGVNFKSDSYDIGGEKAGYHFYSVFRLAVKDLSSSVGEMNEAFEKYKNKVDEEILDWIKPFIDKIKLSWDRLKNIFLKVIAIIKKGFKYVLSVFELNAEVIGWEELDTIDLYELA